MGLPSFAVLPLFFYFLFRFFSLLSHRPFVLRFRGLSRGARHRFLRGTRVCLSRASSATTRGTFARKVAEDLPERITACDRRRFRDVWFLLVGACFKTTPERKSCRKRKLIEGMPSFSHLQGFTLKQSLEVRDTNARKRFTSSRTRGKHVGAALIL